MIGERRFIYLGRKIKLALQSLTLSDGSKADREVIVHPGAVTLLPMVDRDRVCLIRSYRYSIDRVLWEAPAGTMDPGESPEQTATRELTEETGYVAGRIAEIADWLVSPGVMDYRMHLFLCEDLRPGKLDLQPDESIEPTVVSWEDAVTMACDGRIEDAKSILAILIGDQFRRGIRRREAN